MKTTNLGQASKTGVGPIKQRGAGRVFGYSMTVTGTGAVYALARVLVSQDGKTWLTWGDMSATGTNSATDFIEDGVGKYQLHRFEVLAISGTGAVVVFTATEP